MSQIWPITYFCKESVWEHGNAHSFTHFPCFETVHNLQSLKYLYLTLYKKKNLLVSDVKDCHED